MSPCTTHVDTCTPAMQLQDPKLPSMTPPKVARRQGPSRPSLRAVHFLVCGLMYASLFTPLGYAWSAHATTEMLRVVSCWRIPEVQHNVMGMCRIHGKSPHVHPQDLPDEVLMRIICCVHAPDEHWMRHLSSAGRVATVCSRLRWVASPLCHCD